MCTVLSLLLDRYESLSQFYTDVYVVFKQVEEVVGKSSVIWRDATKMEVRSQTFNVQSLPHCFHICRLHWKKHGNTTKHCHRSKR